MFLDAPPSVFELLGLPPHPGFQGISLFEAHPDPESIDLHDCADAGGLSVRDHPLRLQAALLGIGRTIFPVDLVNDPAERKKNLATSRPELSRIWIAVCSCGAGNSSATTPMSPGRAANTRLFSRTDARTVCALALAPGRCVSCDAATGRRARTSRRQPPRPCSASARHRSGPRGAGARPQLLGNPRQIPRTGDTLYSLNAGKLLMPGSTLKIVTLAAAAERLGWDYAYDTRLVATGPIDAGFGILSGDLLVVGSGDPSIVASDGWPVFSPVGPKAESERRAHDHGRIIGDDNAFDDEALGPGWAWDDLQGRDATADQRAAVQRECVQATIAPGAWWARRRS